MNDAFAARVYPTILYMLNVLDRIDQGREPSLDEVQAPLRKLLNQFDVRGPEQNDFALAKYAMVAWIDEVLINSRWSYSEDWRDNLLERQYFGSRNRASTFFSKSNDARALPRTDALETYYLCAALGFQGIYRDGELLGGKGADGTGFGADSQVGSNASGSSMAGTSATGAAGRRGSLDSWFVDDNPADATDDPGWNPEEGQVRQENFEETSITPSDVPGGENPFGAMGGPAARTFARSLKEWAGSIFGQIVPPGVKAYGPIRPPGVAQPARPLRGWRATQRALNYLTWNAVAIALLTAYWITIRVST